MKYMLLLMIVFITLPLRAQNPEYRLFSTGCGAFTHSLVNGSLVLQFHSLEVESIYGAQGQAACELRALVRIPYGKRFKPIQAFADGEVAISQNGSAQLYYNYRFGGEICEKQEVFGPETSLKSFVSQSPRALKWRYSECSDGNLEVPVDGGFYLQARSGQQDPDSTNLTLFNSESQLSARWEWDFVDCTSPLWEGYTFTSRYTSPQGHWVTGKTFMRFGNGFYQTDSGFSGRLVDVEFRDHGRVAHGLWIFENGARGWFRFEMLPSMRQFVGVWGEGAIVGQNAKGSWQGYRS